MLETDISGKWVKVQDAEAIVTDITKLLRDKLVYLNDRDLGTDRDIAVNTGGVRVLIELLAEIHTRYN